MEATKDKKKVDGVFTDNHIFSAVANPFPSYSMPTRYSLLYYILLVGVRHNYHVMHFHTIYDSRTVKLKTQLDA